MYWPFTVQINCSSDRKIFANSPPSTSNFKSFSLEQFFSQIRLEQSWKQNTNFHPDFSKSNLDYGLPFIFHVLIIVIFSNEFAFCSIFRIVQGVMPVLSLDQAVLNPGSVCTIIEKSSDIITNIVISSTIWQPIDT